MIDWDKPWLRFFYQNNLRTVSVQDSQAQLKKKALRSGGRGSEITQGLVDSMIRVILPSWRRHVKTHRDDVEGCHGH